MKITTQRFYILLILLIIGASSCKKDTTWNSDWIIPLVNDSLVLSNYYNDTTLAVNSDNTVQIIYNRNLYSLNMADIVKMPDTTIEQPFSIKFPFLTVPPGLVFINQVEENIFSFGDAVLLEAGVKSGKAKVVIKNPVPVKAIFTVSLPGVIKDGVEFTQTITVDGGTQLNPGVGEMYMDFEGYTIDLRGVSGMSYNILQSKLMVQSDPQGSEIIISNQDEFIALVTFQNLKINYAKGYLGNIALSDTTEVNLDIFNNIVGGSIDAGDVNVELSIRNGIKASGLGKITLFESENYQNNIVGLTHPYFDQNLTMNATQGQFDNLVPSKLIFTFDNTTGNLKQFIENLGSKYRIGYDIQINPYGNLSGGNDVIYPQSRIDLHLKADFPLEIGTDNLTLLDTFEIDIKNEDKWLRVESGELILKTFNSFPYGVDVSLALLNENHDTLRELEAVGNVLPAPINASNDGHEIIEREIKFIINNEDADALKDSKYILIKAVLNSTYLTSNPVYMDDALKFLLQGKFKLKVKL
ncbi:MAG: hypothetical protein WC994_09535 [Brumimicrobium sp.]